MIERIYERSRGMAQVSRRLFAQVQEPGSRLYWAVADYDPFVLLENELARVVSQVEHGAQAEAVEPVQRRAAENRIRPAMETPGSGHAVAEFGSPAMQQPGADRQPRSSPPQFSRRQPLSLPWSSAPESANLHQDGQSVSKPRAARESMAENPFAGRRNQPSAFPQFTYGRRARETSGNPGRQENSSHRNSPILAQQQRDDSPKISHVLSPSHDAAGAAAASPVDGFGDRNLAASTSPQNSLDYEAKQKSSLVQTSGLIHLLKKNSTAAKATDFSSSPPAVLAEDAAVQQQALPAGRPAPALTVETVLDELEDHLRFEFLRTYGSSGE